MPSEKFKALVHHIVHECADNPGRLGSIRLNKVLWFTDVIAYQRDGVSVSGETYVKRKRGPAPKFILAALDELAQDGCILVQEPKFEFDPRRFFSLTDPNDGLLSDADRNLVKRVMDFVCQLPANEVSELTHDEVWAAAREGEEIPLYATLVSGVGELTDAIREWADSVICKAAPA